MRRLIVRAGDVFIADSGSTCGTRVNGQLIGRPRRFAPITDHLDLGDHVIRLLGPPVPFVG